MTTTDRQWIFPMNSKADVVMPDIGHRYWSTHCRHGNHADCKGSCKICGSPCVCAGCTHEPVEGSTPVASPARARPRGLDALLGYVADHLNTAPAGEVVSVPPPVTEERLRAALAHDYERIDPIQFRREVLGEFPPDVEPRVADEPAPVPPPVDALEEILKLAERLAVHRSDAARDADRGRASARQHHERADAVRLLIAIKVEEVRAAGVEEGRRRLEETAATAAAHAYELGIAEGRRQQAAEVERLQVLLDHAEQYARDLQDGGTVGG